MKYFLIGMFTSIFTSLAFGQKVTIQGIATDSNGNKVQVVINEKSSKFYLTDSLHHAGVKDSTEHRKLTESTDETGLFKVNVYPSDSLIFTSANHIKQSYLVTDLLTRENIRIELKPKNCIDYTECESPATLYAFIGRKIEVQSAKYVNYCNTIVADSKYDSEYEVVKNIYGDFPKDTIKFVAYDHMSRRPFYNYENVLIYVVDACGELIHVKYQYHDLYKTIDGKWASPYNPYHYQNNTSISYITPKRIEFEKPIEFEVKLESVELIKEKYPEPYFEHKNGKVRMVYGVYPEELFEFKKNTALRQFGLFE